MANIRDYFFVTYNRFSIKSMFLTKENLTTIAFYYFSKVRRSNLNKNEFIWLFNRSKNPNIESNLLKISNR